MFPHLLHCTSIPKIQSTSGLQSAFWNSFSRPTVANDGCVTIDSSMVENVGIAVGLLLVTAGFRHSALFHDSAAILEAILKSGSVT
jgi:hypothetical protein